MEIDNATVWLSIGQIIWIDLLLSGDNAVMIAMACRALRGNARWWGMALGVAFAVVMRVVFTGLASTVMEIPYLKILGALALGYIAIDLLRSKTNVLTLNVNGANTLWRAVMTIVVADSVMSLDNVIAIAAVAKGSWLLLVFGFGISIPMIVSSSAIIMTLLDRLPILVWAGAGLLGWIAGGMLVTDAKVLNLLGADAVNRYEIPAAIVGVGLVLIIALWCKYGRHSVGPNDVLK